MADPALGPAPGGYAGFGGFPFGGLGGGFGFDAGIGAGLPGLGYQGFGGGGPGIGGLGGGWAPYVPITPLGALGGVKGDLIVPIVAVGIALFILLIIFLAVKAALAWKMTAMDHVVGHDRLRREVIATPPAHDEEHISELAKIVINALDSESCLDKIICSIGSYGSGSSWPSYLATMESLMPEDYKHSLSTLKKCAEGSVKVEEFKCGRDDVPPPQQPVAKNATQGGNGTQKVPAHNSNEPISSNEIHL